MIPGGPSPTDDPDRYELVGPGSAAEKGPRGASATTASSIRRYRLPSNSSGRRPPAAGRRWPGLAVCP
jgi:hypothetical protein